MFWSKKHQEFLRGLPLLGTFDDKEIDRLADLVKERAMPAREELFKAGEVGHSAFIIYEGQIKVFVEERSGRVREVATLNKGDMLGQVAFLDGGERSATCAAGAKGATVLELRGDKFTTAFDKNEPVAFKLLDVFTRVLVGQFRSANQRLSELARREQSAEQPRSPTHPEIAALFTDINAQMAGVASRDLDLDLLRGG